MQTESELSCRADFGWAQVSPWLHWEPAAIFEPVTCVCVPDQKSLKKPILMVLPYLQNSGVLHLPVFTICTFLELGICLLISTWDNLLLSCLLPRYSTIYTMFPVFSLVLDKDVKSEVAMLYPELYKDLLKVWETLVCVFCLEARASSWSETVNV